MRPLCMSLPTDARPAELPSVSAAQISPCFSWKERRTPIQGPHRLPSKRHRHACMSCLVVNGLTSMTTSLFFFSFPFERVHSQVRARYICTLSEMPVTLQVRSWAKVATSWSADSDMRMCWSGVSEGGGCTRCTIRASSLRSCRRTLLTCFIRCGRSMPYAVVAVPRA